MTTEAEKLAFAAALRGAAAAAGRLLGSGSLRAGASRAASRVAQGGARSGAITGAAGGAALNVGREALSGKEDKNYLGAALHGAALGGAAGGALGHAGRTAKDLQLGFSGRAGAQVGKNLQGAQLAKETAKELGHQAKQFGQQQIHGFTGGGKGRAGEIGLKGKEWGARQTELLKARQAQELAGATPAAAAKIKGGYAKKLKTVAEDAATGQSKIDTGVDNLAGVAKGLWNKGTRGKTLGAIKEHGIGASTGAKLMSVGIPGALTAADLAKGDESAQGGRSIGQKLVGGAVDMGTGVLTGGMGMLPSMAAYTAASTVADKAMGVGKPGRAVPGAAAVPQPPTPGNVPGAPRAQMQGVATPKAPTAGSPMRALS